VQDGSQSSPFEWFFNALARAIELGAPYEEATVTVYLQKGDHYLLEKTYAYYTPEFTDKNS